MNTPKSLIYWHKQVLLEYFLLANLNPKAEKSLIDKGNPDDGMFYGNAGVTD